MMYKFKLLNRRQLTLNFGMQMSKQQRTATRLATQTNNFGSQFTFEASSVISSQKFFVYNVIQNGQSSITMDCNKTHQEQNTVLAKAVNHLKVELRKSKHEVLSLRHQLQSSREKNVQLAEQQADIFQSIGEFESRLDEVFANNSHGYALLSTSIEQISVRNPRRSHSGAFNLSNTIDVNNRPTNNIPSISNASGKSRQSFPQSTTTSAATATAPAKDDDDILNTAFLDDSAYGSDESNPPQSNSNLLSRSSLSALDSKSKLIKKPSRLPIPTLRAVNFKRATDNSIETIPNARQRRSVRIVDYREQPINRKLRRLN